MKKSAITKLLLIPLASMTLCGVAGCSSSPTPPPPVDTESMFSVSLASGKKELFVGETDTLVTTPLTLKAVLESTDPTVVSVDEEGNVVALKEGRAVLSATIHAGEDNEYSDAITVTVHPESSKATGGFNFSVKSTEEKTEILGKLEKYAMDSHLTGITLFENGGYVKYREKLDDGKERVHLPTTNYITGYGFGLLGEGQIMNPYTYPIQEGQPDHRMYLHTASAEDPKTINAYNASGSAVSDLFSYIASSYWSTKMNATKDGYVWFPLLAKDEVNGQPNSYPIAVDSSTGALHSTWRIYVKTGAADGLKFRTLSTKHSEFDKTNVTIDDYMFAYQMILTGSCKQKRGSEMAGDTSYGIKGARAYFNRTKNSTAAQATATFNSMVNDKSLGIQKGSDANGDYLDLTLVNPIDAETARYTLSSDLVEPLSKAFVSSLVASGDYVEAIVNKYGQFDGTSSPVETTLCCGPYMLELWDGTGDSGRIVFKKNNEWNAIEPDRYKIQGIRMKVYTGAKEDENFIYTHFQNDKDLDSTGIPTKFLKDEKGKPSVYETEGDSTFKLNVNSCTQERWNELFGPNGKIQKNCSWDVKPWMSNEDFLNGLFYSINRKQFAENRGVKPSINYFSNAYLTSPSGTSYNESNAHKNAVADYLGSDGFGYDYGKAVRSFRAAVNALVAKGDIVLGTKESPTEIKIHIRWMYQSDIKEYGDDIKQYFESAFNDEAVCGGLVKLKVEQQAVTNWEEVYNEWLMKGQFDLGFGAISGNTFAPLNFMEVLKSDNSSGFTLNWGADTSKVDTYHPIVYNNGDGYKTWSFDSLWEIADHGGVTSEGSPIKPVTKCYLDDTSISDFSAGNVILTVPTEFISVPNVKYTVTRAELYVLGYGNVEVGVTINQNNVVLTISPEQAAEVVAQIREANKLKDGDDDYNHTFTRDRYGRYWTIDLTFTLQIGSGAPTDNYITAGKDKDAKIYD